MKKRIISLLLILCMLLTAAPATVLAEEAIELSKDTSAAQVGLCAHHTAHDDSCGYVEGVSLCEYECAECAAAGISFSSTKLALSAEATTMREDCGMLPVKLTRFATASEQKFKVVIFDTSTNYGSDYNISYLGTTAEKIVGAQSIYDAFKNGGELTDATSLDLSLSLAIAEQETAAEESGEEQIVSAADMLKQLDELNARAVEIEVTFDAGDAERTLSINVIDDAESEYEESFMMFVLDASGEVIEGAQQSFSIIDNEAKRPEVTVCFDCESEMELTDENETAVMTFTRSGDLATSTLVTLNYDGEPYGQVNFAPYQEIQQVEAVVGGVYTLEERDGVKVGEGQVEVFDNTTTTYSVQDGGDAELDAIPDSYAVIRSPRTGISLSWRPKWASGEEGSNELQKIIMGSASNNLYTQGGGGAGSVKMYAADNVHNISTCRSRSTWSKGNRNMDLITPIDLIGVESIETTVMVDAIDSGDNVNICFGIEGLPWNTLYLNDSDEGKAKTFKVRVPDKTQEGETEDYRQASKKVYYSNIDPDKSSAGTDMYVPNALKLNLRRYRFIIESDPNEMAGLNNHMTYAGTSAVHVPTISTGMDEQILTINSQTYGTKNKKVVISYNSSDSSEYPARLVACRVKKYGENKYSEKIQLVNNSFTFDEAFLRKYEMDYCVYMSKRDNGEKLWTFQIIPIYEKIYVGRPTIISSIEGEVEVTSLGSDCLGDQWIIRKKSGSGEATLSGVWYQGGNSAQAADAADTKTTYNHYDKQNDAFVMDIEYRSYKIQGVWSADAARLLVFYENNASSRGTLQTAVNKQNEVVSGDSYIVGSYVTLMALPNDGYHTRWHVKGSKDYYYGDTFYYQLDGNPDHNIVYVDFLSQGELIAEGHSVTTCTLTGTLRQSYVEARDGDVTQIVAMDNTTVSVNASVIEKTGDGKRASSAFTDVTDENGDFTLKSFRGVEGGTYSMMVMYKGYVSYTTFVYDPKSDTHINIQMPQFASDQPYPYRVSAYVSGEALDATSLNVTDGSIIYATTRVHVPASGSTVTAVTYYFADESKIKGGVAQNGVKTEAKKTGTDAKGYELWSAEIKNSSELTSGMKLFVVVDYQKTDASGQTHLLNCGEVDTGYCLATAVESGAYDVLHEIPDTLGMRDLGDADVAAYDADDSYENDGAFGRLVDHIDVPIIGVLDYSFSSSGGGFFTTRSDENGNTYMMCGKSSLNYFGTGTITQKMDQLKALKEATSEVQQNAQAQANEGGANVQVPALSGTPKNNYLKIPSKNVWTIEPAFLFMITISENSNRDGYYVSSYLMSLGVDAFFTRCFPFSVYGVPLYVTVCFTTEFYYSLKLDFAESQNKQQNDIGTNAVKDASTKEAADEGTKVDTFIAAPVMKITLKGGVGVNGFCSLYMSGSISAPFIIQFYPGGIAVRPSVTLGFGADLVVFNVEFDTTVNVPALATGEQVLADLKTILGQSTSNASVQSASARTAAAQSTDSETMTSVNDALRSALSTDEIMKQLNNATFSPIVTSEGSESMLRTLGVEDGSTIDTNVFKNTGVHLLKQGGKILAFYLQDTRGDDKETLNYLSVAYAESTDNGANWTKMGSVSNNTGGENTSLQYGVDLYDLGEGYTLLTWSEANFDEMLKDTANIDINKLTAAQVAKLMNAMSLKGRLLYNGEFVTQEAFTISTQDSTVFCGALDAVMNGDTLYVYYQRNVFPESMKDGDVTLGDILNTTRTIALARSKISGTGKDAKVEQVNGWTATQVRAMNQNDQEYRITEVEPFVHNGVMGEILVLDRDGKLAEWDSASDTWTPSNEDRQLYLRTYTFAKDGTPTPSALMAITDANDCCQNPQVVSNDKYLNLFWNRNGEIVYVSDFVATTSDNADTQNAAYVVVNPTTGEATKTRDPKKEKDGYDANHIASDDEHLNIGTTFSASMDDDGHVLLSWVATDVPEAVSPEDTTDPDTLIDPNEVMSEEVFGVVLEPVDNKTATSAMGSGEVGSDTTGSDKFKKDGVDVTEDGNASLMQLTAKGSPIALTNENSDVGALDSVFLGDVGENSTFLLAFSTMNYADVAIKDENGNETEQTKQKIVSANVKSTTSEYATELEITAVTAPDYPTLGKDMTVTVTVANNGLKEAKNVTVSTSATNVEYGNKTIDSILPGRSKTIELEVLVSDSFSATTNMSVTATCGSDSASAQKTLNYGPHFTVRQTPTMSNVVGTSDYDTVTTVYNEGNAAGTPTLYFKASVFNGNDKDDDEKYTIVDYTYANPTITTQVSYGADGKPTYLDEPEEKALVIEAGSFAMLSYTLEKTPVTSNDQNGTLTVYTVDPDDENVQMKVNQYIQGQMPKLKSVIAKKSDVSGSGSNYIDSTTEFIESIIPIIAQESAVSFTDVSSMAYYYDAVQWAVENGITNGTSATTFSPEDTCTRAEAVTFLWRAAGSPEPTAAKNPFTDVGAAAYYYKAVLWAVENGITNGTSASTFSPDEKCTRGQIVTFLWRAANSPKPIAVKNPFTDVGILAYHYKAVLWAVENDITNGTSPTTFGPNEQCTRAQIVTFLYRYKKD